MEREDKEFSEEELMNVYGGFQIRSDAKHPFEDEEIYGQSQKEKLQELKAQLEEMENSSQRRSSRR